MPFTNMVNTCVPVTPPEYVPGDYLTLAELEVIEREFAHLGVSILGVEGASGPEWTLVVPIKGVQTKFRARRVVAS